MKEAHRYGIASRKVHLNPTSELALLSHAPRAGRGVGMSPWLRPSGAQKAQGGQDLPGPLPR